MLIKGAETEKGKEVMMWWNKDKNHVQGKDQDKRKEVHPGIFMINAAILKFQLKDSLRWSYHFQSSKRKIKFYTVSFTIKSH